MDILVPIFVKRHAVGHRAASQTGGDFGQKTGKGFYSYEHGPRDAKPDPWVDALIAEKAKELGLPLEKVRLSPPDTAVSPYDQATSMSRTTVSMGLAVKRACDDVRSALAKAAGDLWDMPLEKITVADGQVFRDGEGHSYGDVIEAYFGMPVGELGGDGMVRMEDEEGVVGDRSFWEISVGAAEVEVDALFETTDDEATDDEEAG